MAFKNKKEEVIDIKLTQFGKNLLSRGAFKPVFYRFYDDGIIYDRKYAGVSEPQNSIEDRIKDDIVLDTQYLVKGIETRFDAESEKIKAGERPTFLELKRDMDPIEKEKLLQFPLASCTLGSQKMPHFFLESSAADIVNPTSVQYLTQSGIQTKIPQINIEPKYNLYIDKTQQIEDPGTLYDSETYLDLMSQKIEFIDKTFIEIDSECLAISLSEENVPYTKENFELELYEIIDEKDEDGAVTETKIVSITDPEEIFDLFEISTDTDADKVSKEKRTTRNFYTN
tara:strand:+ start:1932 stop:2783 length:852 start_codon:yes stop_codon:yes gene_type:complete